MGHLPQNTDAERGSGKPRYVCRSACEVRQRPCLWLCFWEARPRQMRNLTQKQKELTDAQASVRSQRAKAEQAQRDAPRINLGR